PWSEQKKSGDCAVASGRSLKAWSIARAGVRDLIVVFDETNERFHRNAEGRSATQHFSPRTRLPLIQETVLRSGNEFLRFARVIAEIPDVLTGQRHNRTVMKVIVPHPIQTVAACFEFRVYAVWRH